MTTMRPSAGPMLLLTKLASSSPQLPAAAIAAMRAAAQGGGQHEAHLRELLIGRPELTPVQAFKLSGGARALVADRVAYLTRPDLSAADVARTLGKEARISVLTGAASSPRGSHHLYAALSLLGDRRVAVALLTNYDTPADVLHAVVATLENTYSWRLQLAAEVSDALGGLRADALNAVAAACQAWHLALPLTDHLRTLTPANRVHVIDIVVTRLTGTRARPWNERGSGRLAGVVKKARLFEETRDYVRGLLSWPGVTFDGLPLDLFLGVGTSGAEYRDVPWQAVLLGDDGPSAANRAQGTDAVVSVCGEDQQRWATLMSLSAGFTGSVGELMNVVSAVSTPPVATSPT